MQVNYYSVFIKIQKLQNWRKKKEKELISVPIGMPSIGQNAQNQPVQLAFKSIRNVDVLVYIPATWIATIRYRPPSIILDSVSIGPVSSITVSLQFSSVNWDWI